MQISQPHPFSEQTPPAPEPSAEMQRQDGVGPPLPPGPEALCSPQRAHLFPSVGLSPTWRILCAEELGGGEGRGTSSQLPHPAQDASGSKPQPSGCCHSIPDFLGQQHPAQAQGGGATRASAGAGDVRQPISLQMAGEARRGGPTRGATEPSWRLAATPPQETLPPLSPSPPAERGVGPDSTQRRSH